MGRTDPRRRNSDVTDRLFENQQLEKAALLAEVIDQVKALKSSAAEISRQYTIPSDTDELVVEPCGDGPAEGGSSTTTTSSLFIKVTLCCEDRPELLVDLKKALRPLQLRTVHAELSTLGKRLKNVFVMAYDGNCGINRHILVNSVRQAVKSVVDKADPQIDFAAVDVIAAKRRRLSPVASFGSSSSSGSHSSQLIF